MGLESQLGERHSGDCDCPICNMMAENAFGPSFIIFDGHQLELDEEFAFSSHELREDWEMEQGIFGDMDEDDEEDDEDCDYEADDVSLEPSSAASVAMESEVAIAHAGAAVATTSLESDDDEFASVWSNAMSDAPLPGDRQGYLKFAFLLAEIISLLQSASTGGDEIQQLNERFTHFRRSPEENLAFQGRQLSEALEACAAKYPQLVSRVADFQSKIDEHIRVKVSGADCDFTL